jgi:hypothetical protein
LIDKKLICETKKTPVAPTPFLPAVRPASKKDIEITGAVLAAPKSIFSALAVIQPVRTTHSDC